MILIDRHIPKNCDECFCNDDYYRCGLLNKEFPYPPYEGRMTDCPLVERKNGEWKQAYGLSMYIRYKCSVCGKYYAVDPEFPFNPPNKYNFCPNCGSDMRGEP